MTSRSSSLDLPQDDDDITEPGLSPSAETDRLSGAEIDCTRGDDRILKKLGALKALRAEMTQEIDRDIAMLEGTLGLIGEENPS
jgi:hypothetical protein